MDSQQGDSTGCFTFTVFLVPCGCWTVSVLCLFLTVPCVCIQYGSVMVIKICPNLEIKPTTGYSEKEKDRNSKKDNHDLIRSHFQVSLHIKTSQKTCMLTQGMHISFFFRKSESCRDSSSSVVYFW